MNAPPDVAWLAGVCDALARFRVHSASGSDLAWLGISSPDLELLNQCARMTGVGVTRVHRNYERVGCTAHCAKPHLHVHSSTGRWQLVGARALVVVHAVRPHLVARAADADLVLATTTGAPSKPATLAKMAALGWPLPPPPGVGSEPQARPPLGVGSRSPPDPRCVWGSTPAVWGVRPPPGDGSCYYRLPVEYHRTTSHPRSSVP